MFPLTRSISHAEAKALIDERRWTFVDICHLVETYATLTNGSLEWKSARCRVFIRRRPVVKKVKP